jgi:hypothetical protein
VTGSGYRTVDDVPEGLSVTALLRRVGGHGVAIVLFSVFAVLVLEVFPPIGSLEIHKAAADFAEAWKNGRLDTIGYDQASDPETGHDGERVALNAAWMVAGIGSPDGTKPRSVTVVGEPKQDSDHLRATQDLDVTWALPDGHLWTYRTTAELRKTNETWRVAWRPSTVHPLLRHGLVIRSRRVLATRAPIRTVDGATILPAALTDPAAELTGEVVKASHELAETASGRAAAGDQMGASGLQHQYDERLAGLAGTEVNLVTDPNYKPLKPLISQLYLDPPKPGRPVILTIRSSAQRAAESALSGATTPTAVVVLDTNTGAVLADATGGSSDGTDLGLQGRFPPGSAFRPVSMLALQRHAGITADTPARCIPVAYSGQDFRNPSTTAQQDGITFSEAFARDCPSAFAAAAAGVLTGDQLTNAAHDLGFEADVTSLGTPAFGGQVPVATNPLDVTQGAFGTGAVLASPLSLARMSATVASGDLRAPTLVTDPGPTSPTLHTSLSGAERDTLEQLMRTSTQRDAALEPLRGLTGGGTDVAAVAGVAAYGAAPTAPRTVWCTGYRGGLAFAVMVTADASGTASGTSGAGVSGSGTAPSAAAVVAAALLRDLPAE